MYRRYRKIFLLVAMFLLFTENPSVFAQINNAQFLYQTFPSAMIVGQSYPVSITMKNTGTTSWIQSADYKLGSQNPQDNVIWGISRVTLAPGEVIAPGEQKTFIFYVQAPLTPDIYNFQWRMVDLVGWFGDFTLNVTITVTQPSIVVSVKDFGAEGDGITDDAPAIQNAIDSLPPTGGAVYAPAGTYMLGTSAGGVEPYPDGSLIQSALIINKNNVIFGGEGTQTILKLMPHTKMRVISVTSQRVTVEKILVDGNKAERNGTVPWPYGDVVDGLVYGSSMSSYMTIRHCEVKNGIEGGLGSWLSSYVYIHDNFVHDNGTPQAGGEGMSIAGTGNVGGRLINNVFSNNTSA